MNKRRSLFVVLLACILSLVCAFAVACSKPAAHTHTPGDWQSDETKHWHICADCDAKIDEANHTYDNDQDTDCNVCGYVRTVTPGHTHTAGTEWQKDATNHWHLCTAGDGYEMDKANHTYDNDQDTDCNVCGYVRTVTPVDYTANGDYVLDIENAGATPGIYSWTKGTNDGTFGTNANDSAKYFKISSGSGAYDYLYISLKLQARKVITITGTARTSNLTDSTKNSTIGISLKSGSTGAVTGLTSFSVAQTEGNKNINLVGNVTTEGTILLQLSRTSGNTGCEFLSLKVTISDPEPVNVQSVSLDKTTSALKVGETETLTATVTPANADNTNIIWSSSDDTFATVVNGVVTAKKAGTVTITATSEADSTKKASCVYTITNVAPTSIELNRTAATIAVNDTLNLTATVLPANATIKTVIWSSSDDSIATVDANGVVTAKAVGTVTITATATEDSSVKAECAITIKSTIVYAESISLNYTNEALKVDNTLQLTATILPANTDDMGITWESSNTSVATVNASGLVTIVGEGSAVITATSNSNNSVKAECTITATYQTYTVTFMDGTTNAGTQTVRKGATATRPTNITKDGYAIEGWYTNSGLTTKFDFSTPITADTTLYAKWVVSTMNVTYSVGNFESAAIEWDDVNATAAKVEYKLASAADTAYVAVDSELIRQIDADTARVDVLGLKGNESYDFRVTSSSKGEAVVNLDIKAYDRSGYAHYNRARENFGVNTGVGAYNDDGTLKDNAIVIYVTNANKDTVMKDVVAKYAGVAGYEDLKMFQIPYCADSGVSNKWNNKDADGIGWWLNNNQYTTNNAASSKNKVPSNTYDPINGSKLGFRGITNNPIVIRFIGTVEVPEGLTAYNSEQEGGSIGDNGNMARMKNCQHITIEGVGTDAQIHGWGIHFMGGTEATGYQGMSFEVRNIKFFEYTEDALGMEGVQDGTTITGPVERIWVHHNTFLPGHCANPAESDKAEGDGSCDFKRGQYFTCAYNWFEYCHKTNLVGSSDSSLQFNLTYHHNVWWQSGSRIPLARQANIHFYNNYVYGDQAETTTPYSWISKPALSYVHSLRANCYIYTENNYYDGCKNVTDGKNGGKAKGWNNVYFACFGTNTIEDVTTREQTVSGNCSYATYDYSAFDTDPSLFYYDSVNKVSDCAMTDAVTARNDCLKYAGVLKQDYDAVDTRMVKQTPSKALTVPSTGLTIDLTQSAVGKEVSGVLFVNGKNSSGAAKGKDVLAVFTLAENTDVSISGTSIEIASVYGTHLGTGSFSGSLDAGTYFVRSAEKAKEGSISSMSFKCGVTNEQRIANTIALINAIGTVELTADCKAKIDAAQSAYSALDASSKAQVTNASTLTNAINTYNGLAAAPVIEAINAIGTVDANSGSKITAARNAYSKLTAEQKLLVTNYSTLVAAEEAYVAYEVEGINNAIAALADPSTATSQAAIADLLEEYNTVKAMYDGLTDEQKTQVTNYTKVTSGIATLTAANAPYEVKAMIAELPAAADVTRADATAITAARAAYDALTADQKTVVGDITKLTAAEAALAELAAGTEYVIFAQNAVSSGATVSGNYKTGLAAYTVDGQSYTTAVKMESSTTVTFTTTSVAKVTLVFHSTTSGTKVKVNGTSYTIGADKTVVLENLAAGTVTITKDSTNVFLCYAIVEA